MRVKLFLAAWIVTPSVAVAQAVSVVQADSSPFVDLKNTIIGILASAITAAAVQLARKFGVDIAAGQQAAFEANTTTALNHGYDAAAQVIKDKGYDSPEAKTAVLNAATNYFNQHFPASAKQVMKYAGNGSGEKAEAVIVALAARFAAVGTAHAASPVTPPVMVAKQ